MCTYPDVPLFISTSEIKIQRTLSMCIFELSLRKAFLLQDQENMHVMHCLQYHCALFCLLCVFCSCDVQNAVEEINDFIEEYMECFGIPGMSLAVVRAH